MTDETLAGIKAIRDAFGSFAGQAASNFEQAARSISDLRERLEVIESKSDRPKGMTGGRAEFKAFSQFAKTGELEIKEMSIGGGAANGEALVPEFIADEIISQALALSRLSSIVRRTAVDTSNYVRLVNARGQVASWVSEGGTRSETASLQLRERRPTHGELYSVIPVANWLLQDSKFDIGMMIVNNAADQFAKALETAIVSGNGSNQPTGLLNQATSTSSDSASPARNASALMHMTATGTIATDIVSLFFMLAPEYRARSTFVMASGVLSTLRAQRAVAGDGGFLWQQNLSSAVDAPDGLLLGRPVVTTEVLSAVLSSSPMGRKILCGDFQQGYELTQIGPMTVLRDPYSSKGKTLFYVAQRFGGIVTDNNSIRVLVS